MGWEALIPALLSAVGGANAARNQQRGIDAAAAPRPFEENVTRDPWGPAAGRLAELPGIAEGIFQGALDFRPPPTASFGGPSSQMREIVEAIRNRAMGSTFVPEAQELALGMAREPNQMISSVFDRAMSGGSTRPQFEQLWNRGSTGGFNRGRGMFEGFLSQLLGGQQRLGEPAPGPPPGAFPPSGGFGGSPYPPPPPSITSMAPPPPIGVPQTPPGVARPAPITDFSPPTIPLK